MIQKTKNSIKATGDDANDMVAALKTAYVPKPSSCLESAMASRTVYPDNQCADQPCSYCRENGQKTAEEHFIETVQMVAKYLRGMNQDGTAVTLETAIEKYRAEAPGNTAPDVLEKLTEMICENSYGTWKRGNKTFADEVDICGLAHTIARYFYPENK